MIEFVRADAIMTRDLVTARPQDTMVTLARRLVEHRVSALPVCAADGTLLGIVTESDLIRPLGAPRALDHGWWIDVLLEGGEAAPAYLEFLQQEAHSAADLMTRDVTTVDEAATAPEIAELMQQHAVKRIPVVRGNRLVGIVARADLVRALAGLAATAA